MGWSFGGDREKFTLAEMIDVFSWDRISLGGPVFDVAKLISLNEQYIHALTHEQLADLIIAWRLNRDYLIKLMPLAQKRIKKLDEVIPLTEYFFAGDLDYTPVIAEMTVAGVAPAAVAEALLAYVERCEAREGFTAKILDEEARAWATSLGWKPKQAFPLIRLALTARMASPGLFETMETLGKEIARRRLRQAADAIAQRGKAVPAAAAVAAGDKPGTAKPA
jgi:glutamyl-tRNA synthetase